MPSPKISIIVPVYNTEKYLRRCVDSILAQTYADFELLLINDGSTDGSGAICDEYATRDPRVRVFHKTNGGVSSARNLGLDNACGEWITFADSDDYVYTNWLEVLISATDNNQDIACSGFNLHDNNGQSKLIGVNFTGSNADLVEALEPIGMIGSLCNKIFRYSIIHANNLRLDTSICFREDEEFVLRYLIFCKSCRAVESPTYNYYMPDWDKYKHQIHSINSFYLIASIYSSCRKMNWSGSFTKKLRQELNHLLIFNLRKDFGHAFKHLKTYIKSINA